MSRHLAEQYFRLAQFVNVDCHGFISFAILPAERGWHVQSAAKGGDTVPFSLKNAEFEIACPGCGGAVKLRIKDVGSSVTCPHCKRKIHLQDDGFSRNVRKADQAISKLAKAFKSR